MAAPIEDNPGNSNEDVFDEELNMESASFDPLKALYTEIPVHHLSSDVTQYNNVAEFENAMKGIVRTNRGNKRQSAVPKPRTPNVGRGSPKLLPGEDQELHPRRKRMYRNVLTRMDNYEKGPLSLLRRCVTERLQVKVLTRGATELRGMCKGYIVAFDKHFNLAMIDVDELFRCPLTRDENMQKQIKAEKRYRKYMKQKLAAQTAMNETQVTETSCRTSDQKSSHSEDNSVRIHHLMRATTGQLQSETTDSDSEMSRECASLSIDSTSLSLCVQERVISKPVPGNTDRAPDNDDRAPSSADRVRSKIDSVPSISAEVKNSTERVPCRTRNIIVTQTTVKRSHSVSKTTELKQADGSVVEKSSDSRCTERQTGEQRCPASKFLERHVNQLFIRGDNVVSVAILD